LIDEPAVLMRIHNTYGEGEEVYDATRQAWVMNPSRHPGMAFAFGVDRGVVRGVFRIDKWERVGGGRWAFVGRLDERLTRKYAGVDVSGCFRGRNPITYVNC